LRGVPDGTHGAGREGLLGLWGEQESGEGEDSHEG
jgi:hypothetical protein